MSKTEYYTGIWSGRWGKYDTYIFTAKDDASARKTAERISKSSEQPSHVHVVAPNRRIRNEKN